jgi:hypothetical protein
MRLKSHCPFYLISYNCLVERNNILVRLADEKSGSKKIHIIMKTENFSKQEERN